MVEDPSVLAMARSVLTEADFTHEPNRRIWACLGKLADAGRALTKLEVFAFMASAGTPITLGELVDCDPCEIWAGEKYIYQLANLTKRRRLQLRGQQLMHDSCDQSLTTDEVSERAVAGVRQDVEGMVTNEPETASEIIEAAGGLDSFLAASKGVPSPWFALNGSLSGGGWQPGEMVIICARPSMGKTAFALNACLHSALSGVPTVFYSFEMSKESIMKRLMCAVSPLTYQRLLSGDMNMTERRYAADATARLVALPLRIIGASGRTVLAVRSHAERLHRRGQCSMIALDYIGLVKGSGESENRNQELADIAKSLKRLAMELHIPAIVLAQLNRAVEGRRDNRPALSDLRDCGEIEEAADVAIGLYRPGYYQRQNTELQHVAEFIVLKQRNGDTPTLTLEFERKSGRFLEADEHYERATA